MFNRAEPSEQPKLQKAAPANGPDWPGYII